jgi:hypothetical protein
VEQQGDVVQSLQPRHPIIEAEHSFFSCGMVREFADIPAGAKSGTCPGQDDRPDGVIVGDLPASTQE